MIDTSKPMEFFSHVKRTWVPCRFLAMTSNGNIVCERDGAGGVIVTQHPADADCLRNKLEPKRRPLYGEELLALVGTVVYSSVKSMRAVVSLSSFDYVHIGGSTYRPDELMSTSWRRLDGSGLWVEE